MVQLCILETSWQASCLPAVVHVFHLDDETWHHLSHLTKRRWSISKYGGGTAQKGVPRVEIRKYPDKTM
jgi:hypothetical protein